MLAAAQRTPSAAGDRPPRAADRPASHAALNPVWQRLAMRGGGTVPRVQRKVEVGRVDDPLEHEADLVAAQVVGGAAPVSGMRPAPLSIRRCPDCPPGRPCPRCAAAARGEEEGEAVQMKEDPASPPRAPFAPGDYLSGLSGRGAPLQPELRSYFEPRFGHDFGGVRVHADAEAGRAARELGARAFTYGRDIVFAPGELQPGSERGRMLLAHELTHTVQQGAAPPVRGAGPGAHRASTAAPISRAPRRAIARQSDGEWTQDRNGDLYYDTRAEAETRQAALQREGRWTEYRITSFARGGTTHYRVEMRGPRAGGGGTTPASIYATGNRWDRPTRRIRDWPTTYITQVDVDVGNMTTGMTLTWENPGGLAVPTGPYPICPGAGVCCRDCNDDAASQVAGSDCTPKGTFLVDSTTRGLRSTAWALNATFFQRPGIAIHNGEGYLRSTPSSHGCVRTSLEASEVVNDNVRMGTTNVHVHGTWAGTVCYRTENASSTHPRSTECPTSGSTERRGAGRRSDGGLDAGEPEAVAAATDPAQAVAAAEPVPEDEPGA